LLEYKPLVGTAQFYTPGGPGVLPLAARSSRMVAGHPGGLLEAFANLYSDAAEAIAGRRTNTEPDPLSLSFPKAIDGVRGTLFVDAAIRSSADASAWTTVPNVVGE
jgi:hypothetical protein